MEPSEAKQISLTDGPPGARGTDAAAMEPPLVVHVLYRFDTGGLENGVVNLINHMPRGAYRHRIVALTDVTDFRLRLKDPAVECVALHKPPGHGAKVYAPLWRLLRQWRPAVVHTRNLAALEMQAAAWAARVPVRIHGEHGRDVDDLDGSSRHHQRLRRLYAPFVHRWVALSRDLQGYLEGPVGIAARRVEQIYNGVDAQRFAPPQDGPAPIVGCPFGGPGHWLVGTVGRMAAVKDQTLLARAFVRALVSQPALRERLRLVMVGEGPLRAASQSILDEAGVGALAWLPGERSDVADVMRGLNCFVLPSLGEGISNTILEAMATGLPVVATRVGGNAELVQPGRTGALVPAGDVQAMAQALVEMAGDPDAALRMGQAGRIEVERRFSLQAMVGAYQGLYDRQGAAVRIEPGNT
jgi:sugar transferase (PEP-CTERM/EpsH1 system associated)